MKIFLLQPDTKSTNNINFNGKTETFWKVYNSKLEGIPLRDTVINSISKKSNLLGEGFTKQGFSIEGLKDYIIRVYKNAFRTEDLNLGFSKPENNFINNVDGVVLNIPGKIDIVKTKFGEILGVEQYGLKMCPPMDNVQISREETLSILNIYEQLKDFPINSYRQAYKQMKSFNTEAGYQFDILNPNNILIDTKSKKINFIDPMDPKINKCEDEKIDFAKYHGCDTIYPVLCDFLMQKEHLRNLTPEEQNSWKNAIKIIITKCLKAGEKEGFQRNTEQMEQLFTRVDNLWSGGQRVVAARYDNFVNMYSDTIHLPEIIDRAVNYRNPETLRIDAINHLDSPDFKILKSAFEKILEAPHQPKVEIPEILNATIDKIQEYKDSAKSLIPALEVLFNKEIFYPTKQRLYNLFIELQPTNKHFLKAINDSSLNPVEKTLYEEQFNNLYKNLKNMPPKYRKQTEQIYQNSIEGERFPKSIVDKFWISRTCTNAGPEQFIAIKQLTEAYKYIESKKDRIPKSSDLVELHKIILANAPKQENITGKIRNTETDFLFSQIFNIKKDIKKTVNPYYDSKDVPKGLTELDEYIQTNYDKMEPHLLASNVFIKVVTIHPFYNGNGRVARLFAEQLLLSKGLHLNKWPEETLYRKTCSIEQLAEKIKECIEK